MFRATEGDLCYVMEVKDVHTQVFQEDPRQDTSGSLPSEPKLSQFRDAECYREDQGIAEIHCPLTPS